MGWFWPDAPASFPYPHAIVNRVTDEALRLMARQDANILAEATVLRDGPEPVAVLHFSERLGFSDHQLRVLAHELSHATAQLLRLPDRTHDTDGGVID